jgi:hypothetical protein
MSNNLLVIPDHLVKENLSLVSNIQDLMRAIYIFEKVNKSGSGQFVQL